MGLCRKAPLYAIVFMIVFVSLSPVAYMGLLSVIPERSVLGEFDLTVSLDLYRSILLERNFYKYLLNSLVVSVSSVLMTLLLTLPAAYSSVRWNRNGGLIGFLAASRFIPQFTVIISLYLIYLRLGIQDTFLGLILVYTFLNIPIAFLLMRHFFKTFNFEVEEAALCDGSSRIDAYIRVVLPSVAEGLIVVAIICFIMSWNELPFALILTDRRAVTFTKSLLYLLYSSRGVAVEEIESIQLLCAATTLQLIPTIPLVVVLRKLFASILSHK